MNAELLTRTECNVMRGLAILGIFLHNYCHWLNPVVKENDYQYFQHNVDWLMQVCARPDALLPMYLISFFGHYGVPVFLFLSAFGLERKYGNTKPGPRLEPKVNTWGFIRYHFLKLFKMMIVGFICFTIVDAITPGSWHYTVVQIVTQLGMVNNFLAHPDDNIWPGPSWFFGLMLQLYLVYRLLLYRRSSWLVVVLIAVCWLLQVFCDPDGDTLNRLRYNFIGGMLPFGLGVLFGKVFSHPRTSAPPYLRIISLLLALASIPLVIVMSFSFHSWLWIPIVIIIGTIALVKALPAVILKIFVFFGTYSAAMFVAHPIARKLFITVAWQRDAYDGLMLYFVAAIGLSWAVKHLIDRI